ncbi:hypothetical protein CLOSTMETH_02566 [[Clostridium] methylpentosum DSM 5476]|uniref:Uncharacterized protein n=1 Tax=[Clostridium] methylpentosum DSM 5476 TaxID=537013 RepID=C0EFC4_9FIRM|nr:hypothetical protein CLOSTMETH_02566 [[Clostridium] methylpentosum DSM 5476]
MDEIPYCKGKSIVSGEEINRKSIKQRCEYKGQGGSQKIAP